MGEECHYLDFRSRAQYLPQMPLFLCVPAFVPGRVPPTVLEKSRRCLWCRRTPDLSNQLAALTLAQASQALPQGRPSVAARLRVSVLAKKQVGIRLSARAHAHARVVGGCGKICDLWSCGREAAAPRRCGSLTPSVVVKHETNI